MGMHSENGAKLHASKCKGKLVKSINAKGAKGSFELWTCANKCGYVGRGMQVKVGSLDVLPASRAEDQSVADELAADIEADQTETPPLELDDLE